MFKLFLVYVVKDLFKFDFIAFRFLRKSVANFKNTTGYEKKPVYRPKPDIPKEESPKKEVMLNGNIFEDC